MVIIYVICAVVLTLALCVAIFYWVDTLKQMKRSAQALEQFLSHADEAALRLNESTKKVSAFVNGFESSWAKTFNFVWGFISALKSQFSSKPEDGEEKQKEGVSHGQ